MAIEYDFDPTQQGIHLYNSSLYNQEHIQSLAIKMGYLIHKPKGSPFIQLQQWKKIGIELLKYLQFTSKLIDDMNEELERLSSGSEDKKYQRWTPEEDELLIDEVCKGRLSIIELSTTFGRTPSAIKTRVSKLVGMKRISQEIAGHFIGVINNVQVEGPIHGEVIKKP